MAGRGKTWDNSTCTAQSQQESKREEICNKKENNLFHLLSPKKNLKKNPATNNRSTIEGDPKIKRSEWRDRDPKTQHLIDTSSLWVWDTSFLSSPASVFPLSFFLLWFHPPWLLNSDTMLYFLATSFSINAWLIYLWNLNIYLAILKININHDLKLKYELITWCSFLFKNI